MKTLNSIRLLIKAKLDSIDNLNYQKNLLNALPFWIGASVTGVFAIFYAKLFSYAEMGTHYIYTHASWLFFFITPATFVLAWWLVTKYAPYARGSGIPQVSAAIELSNPKNNFKVNKLLSLRVIVVKVLSSLIMVLGGGAIGREGPTIQISAAIFKKINDWLPEWYPKVSKRIMIVTGSAAGLAAAFNTPLGGIVFTIEELTKTHFSFFKSALLTGVIISGLTALNFLGPYLYIGYPKLNNITVWIIFAVVFVAIIAGFAGSWMGKIILNVFKRKKKLTKNSHRVIYTVACGLILAAIAYFVDFRVFGSGKEIMVDTLFSSDKSMDWYVPIIRFLGPIITFSTGASGGIFAPSLSAGASIGAVVSGWLNLSGTETNLIILCGMVGFLTGITRSPFTSSILVLEMTDSHSIIFYLMLTGLLANLVAQAVARHSFYDHLKDQYIREIHQSELGKKKVGKIIPEDA
ncbi:MAG: H+/Cl- antiporter ClcA [Sphingobacteriales bacterium]|jgi:H+/Cl- antiporter ClcA